MHWWVLLLIGFTTFANFVVYYVPNAAGRGQNSIQAWFHSKGISYTVADNDLLDTLYWAAAVITVFFSGIIVEYIGLRSAAVYNAIGMTVAMLFFNLGVSQTNLPLMLVSRVIFGFVGEIQIVVQYAFLVRWFGAGSWFPFVGVLIIQKLATTMTIFALPAVAATVGINIALWWVVYFCFVSMSVAGLLALADKLAVLRDIMPPVPMGRAEMLNVGCLGLLTLGCWFACLSFGGGFAVLFPLYSLLQNTFEVRFNLAHLVAGYYSGYSHIAFVGGAVIAALFVRIIGFPVKWLLVSMLGLLGVMLATASSQALSVVWVSVWFGIFGGFMWVGMFPMLSLMLPDYAALIYGVGIAFGSALTVADLSITAAILGSYRFPPCPPNYGNATNTTYVVNGTGAPHANHPVVHCSVGGLSSPAGYSAMLYLLSALLIVAIAVTIAFIVFDMSGDRKVSRMFFGDVSSKDEAPADENSEMLVRDNSLPPAENPNYGSTA